MFNYYYSVWPSPAVPATVSPSSGRLQMVATKIAYRAPFAFVRLYQAAILRRSFTFKFSSCQAGRRFIMPLQWCHLLVNSLVLPWTNLMSHMLHYYRHLPSNLPLKFRIILNLLIWQQNVDSVQNYSYLSTMQYQYSVKTTCCSHKWSIIMYSYLFLPPNLTSRNISTQDPQCLKGYSFSTYPFITKNGGQCSWISWMSKSWLQRNKQGYSNPWRSVIFRAAKTIFRVASRYYAGTTYQLCWTS